MTDENTAKWLKRLAWATVAFVAALALFETTLYFWLPHRVQAELDERFHGTATLEGDVDWTWDFSEVVVHDVRFEDTKVDPRVTVSGTVDRVTLDVHDLQIAAVMVVFRDMAVAVDLEAKAAPASEKSKKSRPRLTVISDTLSVTTDVAEVQAQGFEYRDPIFEGQFREACVEQGHVQDLTEKFPLVDTVAFKRVCFSNGVATVQVVEGRANLFSVPGMGGKPLKFRGVDGDIRLKEGRVSFGNFSVEGLVIFQGGLNIYPKGDKLEVTATGVEVEHPWFSTQEHKFEFATLSTEVDPESPLKGELEVGPGNGGTIHVDYDANAKTASLKGECVDWESLVDGKLFKGGDFTVDVGVDPPKLEINQSCEARCEDIDWPVEIQEDVFEYQAYKPDGTTRFTRTTGPGTEDWVYIQELPPYVPEAVITIEDPSFATHGGVLRGSLFQSLQDNLERGEFFRGGSTLTQQLAKNLFLYRDKTLDRKMREALYTLALEDCFSKPELLELYLNVVEFGPDVYGIGAASEHYFDKSAAELLPDEAFYLAKILPKPKTSPAPDEGGLASARRLMVNLAKQGRIPQNLAVFVPEGHQGWELME